MSCGVVGYQSGAEESADTARALWGAGQVDAPDMGRLQGEGGRFGRLRAIFGDEIPAVVEAAEAAGECPGRAIGGGRHRFGDAPVLAIIDKVQALAGNASGSGNVGGLHADQPVFGVPHTVPASVISQVTIVIVDRGDRVLGRPCVAADGDTAAGDAVVAPQRAGRIVSGDLLPVESQPARALGGRGTTIDEDVVCHRSLAEDETPALRGDVWEASARIIANLRFLAHDSGNQGPLASKMQLPIATPSSLLIYPTRIPESQSPCHARIVLNAHGGVNQKG